MCVLLGVWSGACLADRDGAFEEALRKRGYFDLLEIRLKSRLTSPKLKPQRKAEVASSLANLYMSMADQTDVLPEKEKLWKQASDLLTRYVSKDLQSASSLRIRINQGNMFYNKARALTNVRKPHDETGAVRPDVAGAFKQAAAAFAAVRDAANKNLDALTKGKKGSRSTRFQRGFEAISLESEYRLAWANYYYGKAFGAEHPERAPLLKEALVAFDVIAGLYEKSSAGYDCLIGAALCLRELRRPEEAVARLDDVLRHVHKGRLRLSALYHKAETLSGMGRSLQAAEIARLAAGMPDDDDKAQELKNGARLVLAKALRAAAEFLPADQARRSRAEAIDVAKDLANIGGKWGALAYQLIADWGAGVTLEDEALAKYAQGENLYRKADYVRAAEAFEQYLEVVRAQGSDMLVPEARYRVGICHYRSGSFEKSADAFANARGEKADEVLAENSAYWATRAAGKHYEKSTDAQTRQRYVLLLRDFAARFPKSQHASDVPYHMGRALADGRQWAEAIAELQRVPKSSDYHQEAYFRALQCCEGWLRAIWAGKAKGDGDGLVKQAQSFARQCISAAPKRTADAKARRQGRRISMATEIMLAFVLLNDNANRPGDALNVVRGFAKRYPDGNDMFAQVAFIELWAHRRVGNLDMAYEKLVEILRNHPTHPEVLTAIKLTGADFDAAARKAKEHGDTDKAGALWGRAAEIYAAFIRQAEEKGRGSEDVAQVRLRLADCYGQLENWSLAVQLYQKLCQAHPEAINVREGLAMCYELQRSYEKALDVWRFIEESMKTATPQWWKAKYRIAVCHDALGNRDRVSEIIRVTRALHPDMGGDELRAKFEKLEAKNR